MKTIPVYTLAGNKVAEETLADELVNGPVNQDLLYYYVNAYRANQRIGTASTKTRGQVSGSGRKPWRQKGTGRARVGEIRNPVWRHGGVVFGPHPRDYRVNLPRKMKHRALVEALRDKLQGDRTLILAAEPVTAPKTRTVAAFLKAVGAAGEKVLLVLNKQAEDRINLVKSVRNLPLLSYTYSDQLNPYEIINSDRIILLREIYPDIRKQLGDGEGHAN